MLKVVGSLRLEIVSCSMIVFEEVYLTLALTTLIVVSCTAGRRLAEDRARGPHSQDLL
jgi:hypothetical protein